jgi:hypothetical protein
MRVRYVADDARTGAEGLFAVARRILAGDEQTAPPPSEAIDLKSGIGRALKSARNSASGAQTVASAAARAIGVVEGTLVATDSVDAALSEAQDAVSHALAATAPETRALCAQRFVDLVNRIDTIVNGATFDGTNLINMSRDNIEIVTPIGGRPHHAIGHIVLAANERGLNLKLPKGAFLEDAEIESVAAALTRARARLIKAADTFLNQASCMAPLLDSSSAAA